MSITKLEFCKKINNIIGLTELDSIISHFEYCTSYTLTEAWKGDIREPIDELVNEIRELMMDEDSKPLTDSSDLREYIKDSKFLIYLTSSRVYAIKARDYIKDLEILKRESISDEEEFGFFLSCSTCIDQLDNLIIKLLI